MHKTELHDILIMLLILIVLALFFGLGVKANDPEKPPYYWPCKHPPCDAKVGPGTYIGSQDLGEAGVYGWRTCPECNRSFMYDEHVPAQSYNPWTGRGTGGVAWRGRFHGGSGSGHTRSHFEKYWTRR